MFAYQKQKGKSKKKKQEICYYIYKCSLDFRN